MPKNWTALADASEGQYVEDDFKRALNQLLSQQALYLRSPQQSVAYRLISNHRNAFVEAADLCGFELRFRDEYEFCVVIPTVARHAPLDTDETLFALVLRQLYHSHATTGELSASGDAVVGAEELFTTYLSLTGRELADSQTVIKALLRGASRYGMARMGEREPGDPQPFSILILPAIADILGEHVINRLGAYLKTGLVTVAPIDVPASEANSGAAQNTQPESLNEVA